MKISEVKIRFIKPREGLVAFASLVVNGDLLLAGIGVHRKLNGEGYRLTYPTRKACESSFQVFHPINRRMGRLIEDAVLAELKNVINGTKYDAGYACHHAP